MTKPLLNIEGQQTVPPALTKAMALSQQAHELMLRGGHNIGSLHEAVKLLSEANITLIRGLTDGLVV